MNISLFGLKGGVGKTSISLNLALELDYPFVENSKYGGVSDILNKYQQRRRAFRIGDDEEYISLRTDAIYDFSTCVDPRSEEVLTRSDLVIVPTLHSYQDIEMTVQCVNILKGLGQNNILIVINRINTRYKKTQGGRSWYTDYENTKHSIQQALKDQSIDFIGIRENKGWSRASELGKSILKLADSNNLMAKNYKGAIEDLKKLFERIESYKK